MTKEQLEYQSEDRGASQRELPVEMEIAIMDAIRQLESIADMMRAFYPENDKGFKRDCATDILRGCGETIRVVTDNLLRNLDL